MGSWEGVPEQRAGRRWQKRGGGGPEEWGLGEGEHQTVTLHAHAQRSTEARRNHMCVHRCPVLAKFDVTCCLAPFPSCLVVAVAYGVTISSLGPS